MGQASTAHYAAGHMVLKQCIQQFCTSMDAKKYMFPLISPYLQIKQYAQESLELWHIV